MNRPEWVEQITEFDGKDVRWLRAVSASLVQHGIDEEHAAAIATQCLWTVQHDTDEGVWATLEEAGKLADLTSPGDVTSTIAVLIAVVTKDVVMDIPYELPDGHSTCPTVPTPQ